MAKDEKPLKRAFRPRGSRSRGLDETARDRVLKQFDEIYERLKNKPSRLGDLFRLHKEHQSKRS